MHSAVAVVRIGGWPVRTVTAIFSDQSQFTHHFKRLVGVTPGQFRTPAMSA